VRIRIGFAHLENKKRTKRMKRKRHLSKKEFDRLTERFARDEDPDDLGVVPTLSKSGVDINAWYKDKEEARLKRLSK
jgi:hypothetical protein